MNPLLDVIMTRRSIRRFRQQPVSRDDLIDIVRAGAGAASAGDKQPWEFVLVDEPAQVAKVTECLRWLGEAPAQGERPTAHIVVLCGSAGGGWTATADAAAASQNILLAAWAKGIGSCWIGSVERERLASVLGLPAPSTAFSVIALGYPAEEPQVVEVEGEPIAQRDASGRLVVQKRRLETVLHIGRYSSRGG